MYVLVAYKQYPIKFRRSVAVSYLIILRKHSQNSENLDTGNLYSWWNHENEWRYYVSMKGLLLQTYPGVSVSRFTKLNASKIESRKGERVKRGPYSLWMFSLAASWLV